MLLGEYAVFHSKQAVVCAINRRMHLQLTPRADNIIAIKSGLGSYNSTVTELHIAEPFHYLTAALMEFKKQFTHGFDITLESEFSDSIGFGSSAAIVVATVTIIYQMLNDTIASKSSIFNIARRIMQRLDDPSSGADIAASILGGVIAYRLDPAKEHSATFYTLQPDIPLVVVYSGSKLKSKHVLSLVEAMRARQPEIFEQIFNSIEECAVQAISAIQQRDWLNLGHIMNIQQGLLESVGVSNSLTSNIIAILRDQETVYGAKISGTGLGDCMVALGEVRDFSLRQIPVEITRHGLEY